MNTNHTKYTTIINGKTLEFNSFEEAKAAVEQALNEYKISTKPQSVHYASISRVLYEARYYPTTDTSIQWTKCQTQPTITQPEPPPPTIPNYDKKDIDPYIGYTKYTLKGQLHRTDGPAYEHPDGYKQYWLNDHLHRTDGPAVIHPDGYKDYYINGIETTEQEFLAQIKPKSEPPIPNYDNVSSNRFYTQYTLNNNLHRTDGPAHERPDGYKEYWLYGKLSRIDGPAVIHSDGTKKYYLNGNILTKEQFDAQIQPEPTKPSTPNYDKKETNPFTKFTRYTLNGKLHRTDGPAIEYSSGRQEYWLDGICLTKEQFDIQTQNKLS